MWKSFRGRMSGGHLRPLAATRVAASGHGKCGKVSVGGCQAATCGHLRPLEWRQVAANGCRGQEIAGGHLRPLAATRVAASGCHFQNQITSPLRAQCEVFWFCLYWPEKFLGFGCSRYHIYIYIYDVYTQTQHLKAWGSYCYLCSYLNHPSTLENKNTQLWRVNEGLELTVCCQLNSFWRRLAVGSSTLRYSWTELQTNLYCGGPTKMIFKHQLFGFNGFHIWRYFWMT